MAVGLISMEVLDPIFSGNGIASRFVARSMLSRNSTSLFVLCGSKTAGQGAGLAHRCDREVFEAISPKRKDQSRVKGISIPLPIWGKLDKNSSYEEFAAGACDKLVEETIKIDKVDTFLCVDWSGCYVFHRMKEQGLIVDDAKMIYFPFCVFHALYSASNEEVGFYKAEETRSIESATKVIALCESDLEKLAKLNSKHRGKIEVLPPPLREDFRAVVLRNSEVVRQRKFITCCLRFTPSKNVKVFCEAVSIIHEELSARGIMVVMCGAVIDESYANECRRVMEESNTRHNIVKDFLDAQGLQEVLSQSLVNIHTAPYEAYGMTIVEAAACGSPSIIHEQWRDIGATILLPPTSDGGSCYLANMLDANDLARAILDAIRDQESLGEASRRARELALSWDEDKYAERLIEVLDDSKIITRDG
ncbi:hypothetical protein GUITHDRAFT_102791 [Guillardia theta CCMP2712]|uniref:Glycosyl transferase family 1 domain-containing protein n=2 Tax=Guillardia theta TaxID=55529 RepID=L1JSV6_GUITC|nr:hypothetical protein GUITHDRAFT_102791 [Guillardia theta CCMP2712]EKX51527.1 hypothetical protein GUITHDRAFT_102791 [Guillardia theta CCMP2712]|eukprot:XP_005838507.1 hypothetical protein GUITHDRAFT_102791 [Guillardia theta CCMP2712]